MGLKKRSLARIDEVDELVNGKPENVDAALPELQSLLAGAVDPEILAAAITALGHCQDPRAASIILQHVPPDHDDDRVRLALARALPSGVEPGAASWAPVIEALIVLSLDVKSKVRDWACFGLGEIEASTDAALEALADRLEDPHNDTRCEALVALAVAGDSRAVEHLRRRLDDDGGTVWELELVAAAEVADPSLTPLLERLHEEWQGDEDGFAARLSFALKRCDRHAAAAARTVEEKLVERVNELLDESGRRVELYGAYPRTRIATIADRSIEAAPGLLIWPDNEPGSYPLERKAANYTAHYSTQA